jgi:hypothetical protein
VTTKDEERKKLLYSIKDPNEYIRAYRAIMAEDAGMQVDELIPFERDAVYDIAHNFVGQWLALCAKLPIEGREQVVESVNELTIVLRELLDYLPADREQLRRDILQCLKRGTGMMPR